MLEVAIRVEDQEGIGRDRWRRLARVVEDLGYAGLEVDDLNVLRPCLRWSCRNCEARTPMTRTAPIRPDELNRLVLNFPKN